MGIPALILGASGSGKSASMRNFAPDDVSVMNVASKPFPFKTKLPKLDSYEYGKIMAAMKQSKKKILVVDDSQYLSVFENFKRAKETGYGKFVDMALAEYGLIQFVITSLPEDTIVYFLRHIDVDDTGRVKAKTIGKMLDQNLGGLEGMFSIVLLAGTDGTDHWFETQSDGLTPCKTPMGMFADKRIPNDLKAVDAAIREYYDFGGAADG